MFLGIRHVTGDGSQRSLVSASAANATEYEVGCTFETNVFRSGGDSEQPSRAFSTMLRDVPHFLVYSCGSARRTASAGNCSKDCFADSEPINPRSSRLCWRTVDESKKEALAGWLGRPGGGLR